MAHEQLPSRDAEHPGGQDVLPLLLGQPGAAGQPPGGGQAADQDREEERQPARAEDGDQADAEDQAREADDDVEQPLRPRAPSRSESAPVRPSSVPMAMLSGDRGEDQAQVDAQAVDAADEDVAAELVDAEEVRRPTVR